jgi:hypothetical protein
MFLSALLTKAGFTPTRIATTATVHLTDGPTVSLIELNSEVEVPGLTDADVQTHAEAEKHARLKALAAVPRSSWWRSLSANCSTIHNEPPTPIEWAVHFMITVY